MKIKDLRKKTNEELKDILGQVNKDIMKNICELKRTSTNKKSFNIHGKKLLKQRIITLLNENKKEMQSASKL